MTKRVVLLALLSVVASADGLRRTHERDMPKPTEVPEPNNCSGDHHCPEGYSCVRVSYFKMACVPIIEGVSGTPRPAAVVASVSRGIPVYGGFANTLPTIAGPSLPYGFNWNATEFATTRTATTMLPYASALNSLPYSSSFNSLPYGFGPGYGTTPDQPSLVPAAAPATGAQLATAAATSVPLQGFTTGAFGTNFGWGGLTGNNIYGTGLSNTYGFASAPALGTASYNGLLSGGAASYSSLLAGTPSYNSLLTPYVGAVSRPLTTSATFSSSFPSTFSAGATTFPSTFSTGTTTFPSAPLASSTFPSSLSTSASAFPSFGTTSGTSFSSIGSTGFSNGAFFG